LPSVDSPSLRNAEVDELENRFARTERDEHVFRLQVAMDDPERMRGLQGFEHLRSILTRDRHRQASLTIQHAGQHLAFKEFHYDVRMAIRCSIDVRHLDYVDASDLRRHTRFLKETLDETGATVELGVQNFDCDTGSQPDVQGLVDRPHAPVPKQAHQAVLSVDDASDVDHAKAEA
jgi:hypothetical protein